MQSGSGIRSRAVLRIGSAQETQTAASASVTIGPDSSGVATPDTMKKNRWHHCASDKVPPERGSSAADSAIFLDLGLRFKTRLPCETAGYARDLGIPKTNAPLTQKSSGLLPHASRECMHVTPSSYKSTDRRPQGPLPQLFSLGYCD